MFTGIISDIGTIVRCHKTGDTRFDIQTSFDTASIALGASIACSGVCLTVVETGSDWFGVEASQETLDCTNARHWKSGTKINLERALRVGDELGGHWVSGHVDGLATLLAITPEGDSHRLRFLVPSAFSAFIAPKGSITLDGVSLTVNHVDNNEFGVNIIPHTWENTIFGQLRVEDELNMEIDLMARYVARQLMMKQQVAR